MWHKARSEGSQSLPDWKARKVRAARDEKFVNLSRLLLKPVPKLILTTGIF